MLSSKEMAKMAVDSLEEKKSIDVRVIDISEVSTIADYFIIGEGSNRNQVQAIADEVEECFEMEIGHLTPDTHLKCKKNKKKQKKNSKKAVNE